MPDEIRRGGVGAMPTLVGARGVVGRVFSQQRGVMSAAPAAAAALQAKATARQLAVRVTVHKAEGKAAEKAVKVAMAQQNPAGAALAARAIMKSSLQAKKSKKAAALATTGASVLAQAAAHPPSSPKAVALASRGHALVAQAHRMASVEMQVPVPRGLTAGSIQNLARSYSSSIRQAAARGNVRKVRALAHARSVKVTFLSALSGLDGFSLESVAGLGFGLDTVKGAGRGIIGAGKSAVNTVRDTVGGGAPPAVVNQVPRGVVVGPNGVTSKPANMTCTLDEYTNKPEKTVQLDCRSGRALRVKAGSGVIDQASAIAAETRRLADEAVRRGDAEAKRLLDLANAQKAAAEKLVRDQAAAAAKAAQDLVDAAKKAAEDAAAATGLTSGGGITTGGGGSGQDPNAGAGEDTGLLTGKVKIIIGVVVVLLGGGTIYALRRRAA